ncbi:MAG: zinc ribbon domain-containing protein [Thermoproteota archaeon]
MGLLQALRGLGDKTGLRGEVFKCPRCGLVIDRQKNASINIWKTFLSMWGVMGSPRKEQSSMIPPMNPEEEKSVEAQGLSMDSILSSEPYKLLEDANLYSLTLCLSDSSKHKPKHIIKLLAIRPRTVKF